MQMENSDLKHLSNLRQHWETYRSFPSMAKLRSVVGMGSTASVFEMVERFEKSGYLQRQDGRVTPTAKFLSGTILSFDDKSNDDHDAEWPVAMGLTLLESRFLIKVPPTGVKEINAQASDVLLMQRQSSAKEGDVAVTQSKLVMNLVEFPWASCSPLFTTKVLLTAKPHFRGDDGEVIQGVVGVMLANIRRYDK
jgi:hypothetical protein